MTELAKTIPSDYGKMPENYDFSTKNTNWEEYRKDFVLRTDAVWEKQSLKDWYRCYLKCFYFDKGLKKYRIFEPEDMYTVIFEGWAIDDVKTFPGFTPTGRTNSFQHTLPPRQRVNNSVQYFYAYQDYYMLCALRFERFFRCDQAFWDIREKQYDNRRDQTQYKNYPCYRDYYEAVNACEDGMFEFLLELAYARRANDTFESDHQNIEIRTLPTYYDSPNKASRPTYTY